MSRVRSRDVWLPLLGLAAIVLAVYSPAISGERIWDDVILLGENQCVLGETPWTDAFTTPFWPFEDYYRPLTLLTLRALNALGPTTTQFHLGNLLLHLIVSLFLYHLARSIDLDRRWAWLTAALFALHPALTESVAWISGLGDLLAAAGLLGSTLAFFRGARRDGSIGRSIPWFLLSALCLAIALLAKETAALLIPTVWIAVWLPIGLSGRIGDHPASRFRPIVGMVLHLVLLLVWNLGRTQALDSRASDIVGSFDLRSPLVALILAGKYAVLLVAPIRLRLLHVVDPPGGLDDPRVWIGILALAAFLSLLLYTMIRRRTRLLFPALWGAVAILPVVMAQPPGGTIFAERYLYLPMIGLLPFALGAIATFASEGGILSGAIAGRGRRILVGPGVALLIGVSALGTWNRAEDWTSENRLFQASLALEPRAYPIAANLALNLRVAGQDDQAVSVYDRFLETYEGDPGAIRTPIDQTAIGWMAKDAGSLYAQRGATDQAAAAWRIVLSEDHTDQDAIDGLAQLLERSGRFDEAAELLSKGIRIHPDSTRLRRRLARCLEALGDPAGAEEQRRLIREIDPATTPG